MTGRERLMSILKRKGALDRPAWAPLIDGYFMSSFSAGKDILDVFAEIGADVMERHVHTWEGLIEYRQQYVKLHELGEESRFEYTAGDVTVTTEFAKKPQGTEMTQQFRIPGRNLTARSMFTKSSPFLPFPIEMLIKDAEDLEAYEYIVRRERFVPRYAEFAAEDIRIGEAGIATDSGLASPIQSLLQHLIGIEPFYTIFLLEHADRLESLMRAMHERNMALYGIIAQSPAEVVIDYENTSTTLISPELYAKYSLNAINDYADILHERGKTFLTHRCGSLKGLMGLLRKGRDDGICDISPRPTGDLDIWDAWEGLPDKVVIGGIDPTFLWSWPVERLQIYVRKIVSRCGLERTVIGSADAVPKNARLENLKAVSEVVRSIDATIGGSPATLIRGS